jgi:hypothetical protein
MDVAQWDVAVYAMSIEVVCEGIESCVEVIGLRDRPSDRRVRKIDVALNVNEGPKPGRLSLGNVCGNFAAEGVGNEDDGAVFPFDLCDEVAQRLGETADVGLVKRRRPPEPREVRHVEVPVSRAGARARGSSLPTSIPSRERTR